MEAATAELSPSESSSPLSKIWGAYCRELELRPLVTKVWSTALVSGLGNAICQNIERRQAESEGREPKPLDLERLLVYSLMGGLYVGPVLHFWFFIPEWLIRQPGVKGLPKVGKTIASVGIDQTVLAPIMNGVAYYAYKLIGVGVAGARGVLRGDSDAKTALSLRSVSQGVTDAVNETTELLKTEYVPMMKMQYTIWPLAAVINYSFVPVDLRVLFVSAMSVIWSAYLSGSVNK